MLAVDLLARALPGALATGASAGGVGTVATAAASQDLATAGVLGGVAAVLGTAGGLVIQYRKSQAENVPALRRRVKTAETALARAEKKHDEDVARLEAEVDRLRELLLAAEGKFFNLQREAVRGPGTTLEGVERDERVV